MKNKMKEVFYGHLDRLIENKLPYAIWGAGKTGIETLALIKEYTKGEYLPEFSIDNNPALWEREDIVSPKDFFAGKMKHIDTVFVCVYVADEVEEQLRNEGFVGNVVPMITTVMGGNPYIEFFKENTKYVERLLPMLQDEQSRDTIRVLKEVSLTGDITQWSQVNSKSENKLMEQDILKVSSYETFVDVGAFIGDSTNRFLDLCEGNYKTIIGIEPDPDNFDVLKRLYKNINRSECYQYAVTNEDGLIRFTANQSESGRISETGSLVINARRLDSIDALATASLIKISTNGIEYRAISGAENLIRKNNPKLSYYCGRWQMWGIPVFLKKINSEYKVYIRHYGVGLQAVIGYATID